MSNVSEFFSDIYGGLSQIGSAVSPAIPAVAGSLLTKEAYDRLSDIGTQSLTGVTVDGQRVPGAMEVAERGQRESQFRPFTVTTPTGSMFSARMGGQPSMGQPMPQPVGQPSMMLPPGFTQLSGDISATDSLKDAMSAGTRPRLPSAYDGIGEELRVRLGLAPGDPLPTGPFVEPTSYMPPGLPQPFVTGDRLVNDIGQPSMALPMGQQLRQLGYFDTMPVAIGPTEQEMQADRQRFLAMSPQQRQQFEGLGGISSLSTQVMPQPTTGGLEVGMTLSPQEQAMQQQLLSGAGGFFGQAVQPTQAREQAIFERMRAAQRPEEERQRLALEERLAGQGRLGVSSAAYGGATPEMLAMATAQEEARNRSMLGAMQQAQAEQMQQAGLGQQFLGAGYIPQSQLLAAAQPGIQQQQLAQQAQQFGTGLFGETMMSGLEARLLAEQARANLLGGVGSNILAGMFTPQVNQRTGDVTSPGGLDIGSIIDGVGSGLGGLFGTIFGSGK